MAEPGVDPQALPSLDGLSFEDIVRAVEGIHTRMTPPARSPDDSMRLVNRRFAPMSNETVAGLPSRDLVPAQPTRGERAMNALMDYGPLPAKMATNVLLQPVHAGEAVGKAITDPSIPTLTNAGVQTGLALFQPAKALGALGAGYVAAGLNDAGVNPLDWVNPSPAFAADKKKPAAAPKVTIADLPGLTPEQNSEYKLARQRIDAGEYDNGAARRTLEDTVKRLGILSDKFIGDENTRQTAAAAREKEMAQAAYDRSVKTAEGRRDAVRATDTSFKDSTVGKLYEETGGYMPFLMAAGGGGVHALANSMKYGSQAASSMNKFGWPAIEGTGLAFAGMNAPLVYDSFSTPVKNPQKEALRAYVTDAPEGDPKKAEYMRQLEGMGMPETNPVTDRAWDQLTSPMGQVRRVGAALVEGVPAGITGRNLPSAGRRVVEGIGEIPGAIATGYHRGMGRAASAKAEAAAMEAEALANAERASRSRQGMQDALGSEREAAAAALEAQRRSSAGMGAPQSGQPSSQTMPEALPPQPATLPNPSPVTPPPIPAQPTSQLQGGQVHIDALIPKLDEISGALREAVRRGDERSAAVLQDLVDRINVAQGVRRPAGAAGKYVDTVQEYARPALESYVDRGGRFNDGAAGEIKRAIDAALPEGVKGMSPADIRGRVSGVRDLYGTEPTRGDLREMYANVPSGTDTIDGRKVFGMALPLAAGGGAGMNALFDTPNTGPGPRLAPAEPYHHSHDQPRRRDGTFK